MISSRPLSRKELSKKLREKGAVEADAESACDWLEEIGALNDACLLYTSIRAPLTAMS